MAAHAHLKNEITEDEKCHTHLLYEYQSGFRRRYSTNTCLIYLLDYIKRNNAKGMYTGMTMLDLQKAFDTVDHVNLCKTLEGIGVMSIKWLVIPL